MKNFNQILKSLQTGKFNALDKVSNGRWTAKQGKNADGTNADFEVAAITGGKYAIQVIENRFLSGLQSFAVKNGLAELGADFIEYVGASDTTFEVFTELYAEHLEAFCKAAKNYVRALNLAKFTALDAASLTDVQCFELSKAICTQKTALGLSYERPTVEQKTEVEKAIAERAAARSAAAAASATASLTGGTLAAAATGGGTV